MMTWQILGLYRSADGECSGGVIAASRVADDVADGGAAAVERGGEARSGFDVRPVRDVLHDRNTRNGGRVLGAGEAAEVAGVVDAAVVGSWANGVGDEPGVGEKVEVVPVSLGEEG